MNPNQFCLKALITTIAGLHLAYLYTGKETIDYGAIANWKWARVHTDKKRRFFDGLNSLYYEVKDLDQNSSIPLSDCLRYIERMQCCLQDICRSYAALHKELEQTGCSIGTKANIIFGQISKLFDSLIMTNIGVDGEIYKTPQELLNALSTFKKQKDTLTKENLAAALIYDNKLFNAPTKKKQQSEYSVDLNQSLLNNTTDSDTSYSSDSDSEHSTSTDEGCYTPPSTPPLTSIQAIATSTNGGSAQQSLDTAFTHRFPTTTISPMISPI